MQCTTGQRYVVAVHYSANAVSYGAVPVQLDMIRVQCDTVTKKYGAIEVQCSAAAL